MAELEYSLDAKNVLNKFHGVEKILYVEGGDDIPFWELMFEKLSTISVKVEEVGGKLEITKHIDIILSGEAEYLVAMDSDYGYFGDLPEHKNILCTYGYSIENTLISKETLFKVIRNVGKITKREFQEEAISDWLESVASTIDDLIVLDVINTQDGIGMKVIPDNSDRFMSSTNTFNLCSHKISDYINALNFEIDPRRIRECNAAIKALPLSSIDILKGHFLLSAAMRFIKVTISSMRSQVSISREMLFGLLITALETIFDNTHSHYEHYQTQINSIQI